MPSFDIKQLGDFEKWLGTRLGKSVHRGLVSAAFRGVSHIQTVIIPSLTPHMPVDRGLYRAAWHVDAKADAPGTPVEVANDAAHAQLIEEGVRADKVKPGRKMIDALTSWVSRKGIGGGSAEKETPAPAETKAPEPKEPAKPKKSGFAKQIARVIKALIKMIKRTRTGATKSKDKDGKTTLNAVTDAQARSIAWAIALSMKEKGIFNEGKGLHVAKKAQAAIATFIGKEVAREIRRDFG